MRCPLTFQLLAMRVVLLPDDDLMVPRPEGRSDEPLKAFLGFNSRCFANVCFLFELGELIVDHVSTLLACICEDATKFSPGGEGFHWSCSLTILTKLPILMREVIHRIRMQMSFGIRPGKGSSMTVLRY